MKYNCDMIQDLMPLCLDQAASEASKNIVLEHMSECEQCTAHYKMLAKESFLDQEDEEPSNKYEQIALKLRKKRRRKQSVYTVIAILFVVLCVNYSAGFRVSSLKAANLSGRLNDNSKVLGSHRWGKYMFYFYDSESCYDVVLVQKTWHGWGQIESYLNWPKWFLDPESRNNGLEMAGAEYFCSYDRGIQVFPFLCWDENVKTVEVTVFGVTKSIKVETGKFNLLTVEDTKEHMGNTDLVASAYDAKGNVLYTLESERGHWMWKSVGAN